MTIAETMHAWAPSDAQRAVLAAGDRCVDLYLELSGPVDAQALRTAVDTVIGECHLLHSVFRGDGTGAVRVYETMPVPTEVIVAVGGDPDRFVSSWLAEERSRALDIGQGPLYRQVLFRLADDRLGWFQRYHCLINDESGMLAIVARVREVLDGVRSDPPASAPFGLIADRLENERRYRESGAWAPDRA